MPPTSSSRSLSAPRAVLFDLNGTLSDDEGIFFEIFRELFAEHGRQLSREEYFGTFVGLSDEELVRGCLGDDFPEVEALLARRMILFRERARDGATIGEEAREAVRAAAAVVPVGVVSGDYRDEIETLLAGAGIRDLVEFVVSIEDVEHPKPDPEQYLLALDRLGDGVLPEEIVVYEDSPVGVAAAKAAGMRCVGVVGTVSAERLCEADEVVDVLDGRTVERLFVK